MNSELINDLFRIVILPLLGALTIFAVKWINAQANQLKTQTDSELLQKYIDMLSQTISECVTATNQTYVDALKTQGKFDKEAQMVAFQMTYEAILQILSEDAYRYIESAVGDMGIYLTQKIEAEVKTQKVMFG